MVGKATKANRTKNNARPSSSSHSAQLLGNSIPTFFGFTVKDGASNSSVFPSKEAQTNIHLELQIQLKQMGKKDATTRYKALQMFIQLCNKLDVDSVIEMLPLWPRTYCSLCTDVDHKVREAAHRAQQTIVSIVKKMIAPYLKELAGPWFTSQYDTFPPAASAALQAFQEAFPGEKYNKAIVFCQKEILTYIYDNLINQTPQSLSGPNTSVEHMEAKYERIAISSLQGYNLYLMKLSTDQIKEAEELNKKLISHPKFWKFSKHKASTIRCSFFKTLATLCEKAKFLLADESARITSVVFNKLDETDPLVLQTVWEAVLNVVVAIEDWSSHINVEKQVFSKIFYSLNEGKRNFSTIYPNILLLLSKIPEDLIKNKETFYTTLFDNLKEELVYGDSNQSISDEKVISNTFIECLKYVIMRNLKEEKFCVSLVLTHLIPTMAKKLTKYKSRKMVAMPLFVQIARLFHYWYSNKENSTYGKIVNKFFFSLVTVFTELASLEGTRKELEVILNRQAEFLIILSHPNQYSPKVKKRVEFQEDGKNNATKTVDVELKESLSEIDLLPVAKVMGVFYFKSAIEKNESFYLGPLNTLLTAFDAAAIFLAMTEAVNESTPFKLFAEYFSKWMRDENMQCDELMNLSLKLIRYVRNDEKEYILEEFFRDWFGEESTSLSSEVWKALSNYFNDPSVVGWMRNEHFVTNTLKLIERFVQSDGSNPTLRDVIISMLKSKTGRGEFIIRSNVVEAVLDLISQNLDKKDDDVSHLIDLSRELISRVKSEGVVSKSFENLAAGLFKLACQQQKNNNLSEICKACLSTILFRCQDSGVELTGKLSRVVKDIIFGTDEVFCLDQIVFHVQNYVKLCIEMNLKESGSSKSGKDLEVIQTFIKKDPELWNEEEILETMKHICRIGHENNEELTFLYLKSMNYLEGSSEEKDSEKGEEERSFAVEPIVQYAKWNLFVGSVLNIKAVRVKSKGGQSLAKWKENGWNEGEFKQGGKYGNKEAKWESDDEKIEKNEDDGTLRPLLNDFAEFMASVGLLESFGKHFAATKHYNHLKDFIDGLKKLAKNLLTNVSTEESKVIYSHSKLSLGKTTWCVVEKFLKGLFRAYSKNEGKLECKDYVLGDNYFEEFKNLDFTKITIDQQIFMKITTVIEYGFGHLIAESQWDRIFICVHNFVDGFAKGDDFSMSNLLTLSAAARLFSKMTKTFSDNNIRQHDERIPQETCLAWNKIVQADVYNRFLAAWRVLAKKCHDQKEISAEWYVVLGNVSDVVVAGTALRKMGTLDETMEFAIECLACMISPHIVIQITSFRLCLSLIPHLVHVDAETFGSNVAKGGSEGENSLFERLPSECNWMVRRFVKEFSHSQGIVDLLLSDFKIGDSCVIEPFTDSFTFINWFLLFSCFLLEMCGEAHLPLRFQYGCWLVDSGFSALFLQSVFKLMPQEVLFGVEIKEKHQKYFESYGSFDFREPIVSERIEHMACYAYRLYLERLPNLTRQWWIQRDTKTAGCVDKVTTLYVSPILISLEFKILSKEAVLDQMEVKTYLNSREVVATYNVEDVKMDLVLVLPVNYPLGTINIESSSKMFAMASSRSWLFHLSKYFFNQNGTIWDALAIWKSTLDKKFQGREECYICFSIVQGSSLEIPRLSCQTCKKMYHSICLYKWFNTSNKSTCPTCRNLF